MKEASMNPSSSGNCPRACNSVASRRRIFSSLPSRTHCWNRRWQVWYGGYLLGSSRHCAPVPSTHNTPFNTARVSRQGRPRPSLRCAGCRIGSRTDHSASLTSQRPRIGFWSYQSYHSICPKFAANERENQSLPENRYLANGCKKPLEEGCLLRHGSPTDSATTLSQQLAGGSISSWLTVEFTPGGGLRYHRETS